MLRYKIDGIEEKNQERKQMVKISRILITSLVVILLFSDLSVIAYGGITEGSNITFWTEQATEKIMPFDSPGSEQCIHIKAAKNEYEAFQVAVTAPEGLTSVNVSVSDLTGSRGTISSEYIRLYLEAYMDITTPSNIEGKTGLWPDALIPTVDPFFNEARNAIPFDVPAGQNRAIWVDVFVPALTNAGTYTGNLTLTASGKNPASVPITLTVWNFTLPSTASLKSAFGFDGWELLVGHYGNHDHHDQIVPLSKLYAESGLMHRITLETVTQEDWSILPWPATAPIDWTEFDANWSSFLDGIVLPYGPEGARLTSLMISTWGDTDEEKIIYWQHYVSHFKAKGWFDRLFDYCWDEPHEPADFVALKKRASLIEQADPDLRVLVTTDILYGQQYDLIGIIDIWVPVINAMDDKPGEVCWDSPYAGNQRDKYNELLAAGNELWWYQSCMSHGCYEIGGDCYSGWPSYMIDIAAIYNRIMPWQTFKYNISGELYFSTNYAYMFNDYGSNDPWNNQYYFGGNGDGTLFYPGRPDKIGGTHHIPIASIRLKMIREGMEDYEYMKMLQDMGYDSFAKCQVDSVVTNAYTFSHDPTALYTARENMAGQIVAHEGPYYVATTGNDSNTGTIDQPWRTIQHAADIMVAGDTVYIMAGTYNERVIPQNSGSSGKYITYTAYPGDTVTIDGTGIAIPWGGLIEIENKSHINVSGLRIVNSSHMGIHMTNSTYIVVEKNYVANCRWNGIKGGWIACSNIIVDGNEVTHTNLDDEDEAISMSDVHTFEIKNNHVYNIPTREGIDIKDGSTHGAVYKNHIHDCGAVGLYIDAWADYQHDIDVYQNIVHDCPADAIVLATENGGRLENVSVYNNIAYNNPDLGAGFAVYSFPGVKKNFTVINNVFYNNSFGIGVWSTTVQDIVLRNNICSKNGNQIAADDPYILTVDHNLIDGPTDIYGLDFVTGDPDFVNAAVADFHLMEGSPAIDNGSSIDAPTDDFDGTSRPQGVAYDIGAFEYHLPSPCFIATAAYGTPLHEDIGVLRDFRDEYLMPNLAGRTFVRIYYNTSPPLADVIRENEGLRSVVRRGVVEPLVYITRMFVG